jgi:thiamine-monophosphate kinase
VGGLFLSDDTVGDVGERALLAHFRRRIPVPPGVILGPGDDAAVLATGAVTLMTADAMVEGVHFRRAWSSPRQVGRKVLSVNLSDVGAMAGRARYATVSLCLPAALPVAWVEGLYDGLLERSAEVEVALVGGNVSGIEGPVVIDVALLGESARPLRRAGARPGDVLMVTGTLGLAAAGLALLQAGVQLPEDAALERACVRAHLDPDPPLAFAAALAEVDGVHAGMDLSDGLSGDLLALCAESGLAAVVHADALPLGPPLGAGDPLELALHGGEDYQLLLAVDPARADALRALAARHDLRLTAVGACAAGPPAVWLERDGTRTPLPPHAHQHFTPREADGT